MVLRRREKYLEAKRLAEQQSLAFYNFEMNLYSQVALEIDKALLTLSSAAIGLLVTLWSKDQSPLTGPLVILAFGLFISVVISTLSALHLSKQNIVLRHTLEHDGEQSDVSCFALTPDTIVKLISAADFYSRCAFCAGLLSSFLAVVFN